MIKNCEWAQKCSDEQDWSTEAPPGINRKKTQADNQDFEVLIIDDGKKNIEKKEQRNCR